MARVNLTKALSTEYQDLFQTLEIDPGRFADVDRIVDRILQQREKYEAVGERVNAPWLFIGAIHNLESSLNFKTHLHNGDPLTARTRHVPAGRPATGKPPFEWDVSATDALQLRSCIDCIENSLPERGAGVGVETIAGEEVENSLLIKRKGWRPRLIGHDCDELIQRDCLMIAFPYKRCV